MDPGIQEPLMISNPSQPEDHNTHLNWPPVSLLDIVPTIMDWHKVPMPAYTILRKKVSFTGRSLLSLTSIQIFLEFLVFLSFMFTILLFFPSKISFGCFFHGISR